MFVKSYLDMTFFHIFVCRSSAVIVLTCLKMFETCMFENCLWKSLAIVKLQVYQIFRKNQLVHRCFQKQPPNVFCNRRCIQRFRKIYSKKHLYQNLFFSKVTFLRPVTLLKRRHWHKCFPVNFLKFLRTPFLQNTSRRLLLYFWSIYFRVKVS